MEALRTFVILLTTFSNFLHSQGAIVVTANGLIKGTEENTVRNGNTYYAYKGVPYAKPPIGNLRFEPPQPISNWYNIVDATKEKDICAQLATTTSKTYKIHGSEDCLYVNIYTPFSPLDAVNKQALSVMVWIHGGAYQGDNQYEMYGPDFFLEEGVVVVTIASRIGIFGFYSTGDLIAPGNYGLKDQILALRWVKDNIRAFGGDPGKVTLFGGASGAASVSFLTQTPLTKGLYHRAILQSSTSLCFWSTSEKALDQAYSTAQLLNISAADNQDLKNKLKAVDYEDLLTMSSLAENRILGSAPVTLGFASAPVIEPDHPGAVIKRPVYETIINGDFNLTPVLMGINSKGGVSLPVNAFISPYLNRHGLASEKLVPDFFGPQDPASLKEIGDQLKVFYFDGVSATKFDDEQLFNYSGDVYFAIQVIQTARILANFTDVYFYVLSYLGDLGDPERPTDSGVGHAEELNYLFYRRTSPVSLAPSDLDTRNRMLRMWVNFAKTSNPTPQAESVLQNVVWKKVDKDFNYLDIGIDLTPGVNPHQNTYQFWINLFNAYSTIN